VIEIRKYDPEENSYNVTFDVQDGNNSYNDTIKAKDLRSNKSLKYSMIALE
jgi:hypothetical protein